MALKDIHVVLQEELIDRLGGLARSLDVSRNLLIREAIEDYLIRKERERVERELDQYIEEMAPHSGEFTAQTSLDVAQMLLDNTEW